MDDLSTSGKALTSSLDQLRIVNRFLGGYSATLSALAPWLARQAGRRVRLLDVGTGVGDFPEMIVRWAARHPATAKSRRFWATLDHPAAALDLSITAVDANPATVAYARERLSRRLPPDLAAKVCVEHADALALPYPDQSFDIAIAAMFLHHFPAGEAVDVLREMSRVATCGIVVNDLQRHPAAYYGIAALTRALPASPMVRHDGPLSVLRGFTRTELAGIAERAGIAHFTVRWHWAFRWVLSSVESNKPCATMPS